MGGGGVRGGDVGERAVVVAAALTGGGAGATHGDDRGAGELAECGVFAAGGEVSMKMLLLPLTLIAAAMLGWWLGENAPWSVGWSFGVVLGLFGGIPAFLAAKGR